METLIGWNCWSGARFWEACEEGDWLMKSGVTRTGKRYPIIKRHVCAFSLKLVSAYLSDMRRVSPSIIF
ncbi:hypothetical protein HanRHA438_Chr07g0315991 [Helianthus annuus]|nr:hypothetical protein HanRHA438_Chr07g0315991 [Helianthus annuus]